MRKSYRNKRDKYKAELDRLLQENAWMRRSFRGKLTIFKSDVKKQPVFLTNNEVQSILVALTWSVSDDKRFIQDEYYNDHEYWWIKPQMEQKKLLIEKIQRLRHLKKLLKD